MSGLPNIYNAIFGKTWAPNQIMPRWVIEGIATYEESKRSAGGRNRGTRFDEIIRDRAARRQRPAPRSGQRRAAPVSARQRGVHLRLALPAVRVRSLRRRHAARDVAHVRCATRRRSRSTARSRRSSASRSPSSTTTGRATCAIGTACRRWRPSAAACVTGRALTTTGETQHLAALHRRRHASCTGCSTTATRSRRVRAMPVGGDASARARRRADRRDGAVRPARPTARSSTSRAGSIRRGLRASRICSAGTRARSRRCG